MTVSDALSARFGSVLADDLDEARKCFALERYTACVFHSMRVVEGLLRELVRSIPMGISPPDECLTYNNMNQLYKRLKEKLDTVRGQTKSDEREAQLQLFSDAGDQCLFFMAVRNEMSHARAFASLPSCLRNRTEGGPVCGTACSGASSALVNALRHVSAVLSFFALDSLAIRVFGIENT
jgi:hypothetical protein